jgi:alpha-galactosidase
MFFRPGPARGWICRTPLAFDKWIPSVLFLTHYLPDDPADSQWINVASLVLGQNGIWGDLLTVSDEGVARIGDALARYKQVRDAITLASPRRTGAVGASPEVHEKIAGGRGVVSLFAGSKGRYRYVTHEPVDSRAWHNEGVSVSRDDRGRGVITVDIEGPTAKIVFFGTN